MGRPKPPRTDANPPCLLWATITPCNEWWEETVHALVVMDDWQQQKQLEDAIRDLVRLARRRAAADSQGTSPAANTGTVQRPPSCASTIV